MKKERRKQILVVEQNDITSKVLKHLLTLWGYEFFLAQNGLQALETIRCLTPDLILASFELPDMSAAKFIQRLKRHPMTAYLPILLLVEHKRLRYQLLKEQIPFDDYLLMPPDPVELRLRVERTLRRAEQHLHANSLTKLPGSLAIEREIDERIGRGDPLAVCQYDIDHFKAFNDVYGYDRGNGVLSQMARILVETVRAVGESSDFIGHIGGDDFVVVTHPSHQEAICLFSIQEFDRLIPLHYPLKDRERGYVSVKNRIGKLQRFGLMTLSIAVATSQSRRFESSHHVSEIASEVKRFLKSRSSHKSTYLVDRRKDGTLPHLSETANGEEPPKDLCFTRGRTKPLGQILLEENILTAVQLEEALRKHWQSAQKLGQILVEMKLITSEQLGGFLSRQLSVPYVNLRDQPDHETLPQATQDLIQEHGVFPLSKEKGRLFVAMTDPFDQKIIRQVEELMGCSVEPRLTTEADLQAVVRQPHR